MTCRWTDESWSAIAATHYASWPTSQSIASSHHLHTSVFAINGVDGQIGLETHPADFVEQMVVVFREVRRVLRDDGTLWLNLGDTSNNRRRIRTTSPQPSLNGFKESSWAEATKMGLTRLSITTDGLKEKDAFGFPWLVAFALRSDGWYLRQEIVWSKNFGKPEPSTDRLPTRHEQIFLLTKSKRYHFDRAKLPAYATGSVWEIPPVGRSDHGAVFSEKVVEPCILAGCPEGGTVLDPFFGAGTTGLVAQQHGRNWIGCELNPEYVEIAEQRLQQVPEKVVPFRQPAILSAEQRAALLWFAAAA